MSTLKTIPVLVRSLPPAPVPMSTTSVIPIRAPSPGEIAAKAALKQSAQGHAGTIAHAVGICRC